MVRLNLQSLDDKPSVVAIDLYGLKAIAGEELSFVQLVYWIVVYLSFLNCD